MTIMLIVIIIIRKMIIKMMLIMKKYLLVQLKYVSKDKIEFLIIFNYLSKSNFIFICEKVLA